MTTANVQNQQETGPLKEGRPDSRNRAQVVGNLVSKHILSRFRRKRTDPLREAILGHAKARLHALHEVGQRYLPLETETKQAKDN